MKLKDLLTDARSFIAGTGITDGLQDCGVQYMGLMQTSRTKRASCSIVDPLIGLVLQGRKTVEYGTERIVYSPGDVIVIGHALPMVSGSVDAMPEEPYLVLYIQVDMRILRGVYSDMGGSLANEAGPALVSGAANEDIIDSFARLFRLRRDPIEKQALGPAALREIYFRVLKSDKGRALAQIIHADSKANQVAKAITHIRNEYRSTIKASDLAAISGMSTSVFYDAFRRVTANSPLQFQKDLRLTEAHQLLLQTSKPISEIAHNVGYESAAQFSREFSKKFGSSPRVFARETSS